jgi:hypothetical protein
MEQEIDLIIQSKNSFVEAVDLINELEILFPYPGGGYPWDEVIRIKAIQLLKEIKDKEKSAFLNFEKLRDHIN